MIDIQGQSLYLCLQTFLCSIKKFCSTGMIVKKDGSCKNLSANLRVTAEKKSEKKRAPMSDSIRTWSTVSLSSNV